MFVDEAEITVKGGNGGSGKVAYFRNRKGVCGGDGGNGGDLYIGVNTNVNDLKKYTEVVSYSAEDGEPGGSNNRIGANGHDLVLQVPIGTTIIRHGLNQEINLNNKDSGFFLCKGGQGGKGNASLRTSTNRTPKKAKLGDKVAALHIKLILKLIAHYGLIGLPNAGKSSLLNALTAANAHVASYPFTTLEPNLGTIGKKIVADIPGLIEGASKGKGLGIKFLKHIEKVELFLHCISSESENITKDFMTVMKELEAYNVNLLNVKMVILITKTDLTSYEAMKTKVRQLQQYHKDILQISIHDPQAINELKKYLTSGE